MIRDIEQKLKEWKNRENRKPLIIRGARQVGKTFTVDKFGKNDFKNYIKIDFEKQSRLNQIFNADLDPHIIFDKILIEYNITANPEETLIFFDEIQLCPRALMSLRYFFEEMPQTYVIAAGSLLEFSLNDASFPVGRVEFLWMYPLNFKEFLIATNKSKLAEFLPKYSATKPLDSFIHEQFIDILKKYFIVGGMPEAVKTYIDSNSFQQVRNVHSNLCNSYIDDFAKYHSKIDRYLLQSIFNKVPVLIGKHLKYSHLAEGRNNKIKEGFEVLQKSLIVYNIIATDGRLPLNFSSNDKIFKSLFLDIGLMQYLCNIPVNDILNTQNLSKTYNGALAEQFVGQQIISSNFEYPKLYFWNRLKKSSQAELDYLLYNENKLIPIEVKSSSSGSLKSLHLFLKTFPEVEKGYVFSNNNISEIEDQKLKFVPLYTQL